VLSVLYNKWNSRTEESLIFITSCFQENEDGEGLWADDRRDCDEAEGRQEKRDLLLVNDGPNIFTIERFGDIPFFHTINDLNLMNDLAVLENFKAWPLND
jgi:hypothetical protein